MVLQAGAVYNPADIPRIIARGFRDSVFPSTSTWTTTEALVYRISNVAMRAGKIYEIKTSPLNIVPSVVNDIGIVRIRVDEDSDAGTGSTLIALVRKKQTDTANTDTGPLSTLYAPSGDLTAFSAAVTLARAAAGTSSTGVRLWGSAAEPFHLWITEVGDDPGVSGTAF